MKTKYQFVNGNTLQISYDGNGIIRIDEQLGDVQWLTSANGHHYAINEAKEIVTGMGGKFNGEKVSADKSSSSKNILSNMSTKVVSTIKETNPYLTKQARKELTDFVKNQDNFQITVINNGNDKDVCIKKENGQYSVKEIDLDGNQKEITNTGFGRSLEEYAIDNITDFKTAGYYDRSEEGRADYFRLDIKSLNEIDNAKLEHNEYIGQGFANEINQFAGFEDDIPSIIRPAIRKMPDGTLFTGNTRYEKYNDKWYTYSPIHNKVREIAEKELEEGLTESWENHQIIKYHTR